MKIDEYFFKINIIIIKQLSYESPKNILLKIQNYNKKVLILEMN